MVEKLDRLDDYADLRKKVDKIFESMPPSRKDAFYQLVVYPVRSAALANERFFNAEIAQHCSSISTKSALVWTKRSMESDTSIQRETAYFNDSLSGGKWQRMMSPEMGPGQWPSMRSTPPKLSTSSSDSASPEKFKPCPTLIVDLPIGAKGPNSSFNERNGVVSIEAEHFERSVPVDGLSWRVIKGLGKTGDSVSIFPALAKTFPSASPSLEYQIEVENAGEFELSLLLVPTQPLVPGGGLRLAFSVDDAKPQVIVVDKDTEVSSRKWAENILDASVAGTAKVMLTKGRHTLRIHAVDTGAVLDKIVLSKGTLPESYFGPPETRGR
jgi:hypothetical protein